ncbi:GNAT family N-acetyltransferase [Stakelama marina]|uniref:GNAT family N-acetyltransferase n=1 Tax=Stakelama marina TaxID=2826939 RepID=A0A8T4IIJ0_9SPHN|nr:GNAT family N-acetyltransferase [Stakelama marina]MBR0553704.1 GNAT family N-acetyltransferase [Stakelama marina]
MGLIPVRGSDLATVVTSLEMTERPRPRPMPDAPLDLVRWPSPTLARYRELFRRVGSPWLWYSRLAMADADLAAIVEHAGIEIFAVVDRDGVEVGMLELDFREAGQCELSYVGLVPELTGKQYGRWLMAHALGMAWRADIGRVWVHTCTLDHHHALGFYRASGFAPFKRTLETFPDPRVTGLLPRDVAPHIPLID